MPSATRGLRRLALPLSGTLLAAALVVWLAPELVLLALTGWVRGQTGRALVVEQAAIHLGWETTLELRGVRLANASWSESRWMLAVDRLRLRAPLGELLFGNYAWHSLELEGGALLLEVGPGLANWEFARPPPFITLGGGVPRIDSVAVRGLKIRYHDPGRASDIVGAVAGAWGNFGAPGWRISGQGVLEYQALTFELQGDGRILNVALTLGDHTQVAGGTHVLSRG